MSRTTADLSQLTHTYSLWKDYKDGERIDSEEFILNEDEVDKLELFLNAKVYLPPLRKKGCLKKSIIQGFPKHLPVYFNEETGQIFE